MNSRIGQISANCISDKEKRLIQFHMLNKDEKLREVDPVAALG